VEKIRRRLNRSVDDFDSTEIRLGRRRNSTALGSSGFCCMSFSTWWAIMGQYKDQGDTGPGPLVTTALNTYTLLVARRGC